MSTLTRSRRAGMALAMTLLGACTSLQPPAEDLVSRGERIFVTETFGGNGRTCATCHRPNDNFTLSPAFIATLPADDALFVAETNADLQRNFENPRLMREFALILENQDGFDDLENDFNMRGIPHTLALGTSVQSRQGPRTGWSGDGAPGDGSLRAFATGAVIQHFSKTTNRVPGIDFRLPTDEELDALEAFQLSLGRQADLELPLPLMGIVPARGQELFLDNSVGKCNICHFNAGAGADPRVFSSAGNLNFNTGVEELPDQPADLTGENVPPDDGFGVPGNGEFNTPPLVEAADTGPFFHNNSVETIEGAVGFYDGDSFNNSPAAAFIEERTGEGIEIDATQIVAIAAFLRVINALENIRSSDDLISRGSEPDASPERSTELFERAGSETRDAIEVLKSGGLHPVAVDALEEAEALIQSAQASRSRRTRVQLGGEARETQQLARRDLVVE
jgi:mono/diheme cytochrome c family protein